MAKNKTKKSRFNVKKIRQSEKTRKKDKKITREVRKAIKKVNDMIPPSKMKFLIGQCRLKMEGETNNDVESNE